MMNKIYFLNFIIFLGVSSITWAQDQEKSPEVETVKPVSDEAILKAEELSPPVEENVAPQTPGYPAKYKYGDLDIQKNTKMSIHLEEETLMLVSLAKKSNDVWELPIKRARGAKVAPRGIWIYWFGKNSTTKSAFFTVDSEFSEVLSNKINEWTKNYYTQKNTQLREKYESYRNRVLEETTETDKEPSKKKP